MKGWNAEISFSLVSTEDFGVNCAPALAVAFLAEDLSASLRSYQKRPSLTRFCRNPVLSKVGFFELGDWKSGNSRIIRDADRVIIRQLDDSGGSGSIQCCDRTLFAFGGFSGL